MGLSFIAIAHRRSSFPMITNTAFSSLLYSLCTVDIVYEAPFTLLTHPGPSTADISSHLSKGRFRGQRLEGTVTSWIPHSREVIILTFFGKCLRNIGASTSKGRYLLSATASTARAAIQSRGLTRIWSGTTREGRRPLRRVLSWLQHMLCQWAQSKADSRS